MVALRSLKLICRALFEALRKYVPPRVLEKVQDSKCYKSGPNALVIVSDKCGSTNSNRQDCIKKLRDILRETAKDVIAQASRKPPKQL